MTHDSYPERQTANEGDAEEAQYIEDLLETKFEPIDQGLDTQQALAALAAMIQDARQEGVTVVSLIGGAASGKTTLAGQLADTLNQNGLRADVIGTDDYVIGDRQYRRDHIEGKDARAKYDFDLLNQKIDEIRKLEGGQTVKVPTYDQASGVAIAAGEDNYQHVIGKLDVLLVEGDFPEVTNPDAAIYVHMPSAARLHNRTSRDTQHRSEADEAKIKQNFELRQQTQHKPYTLPAAEHASVLVDVHPSENGWQYDLYQAK